MITEDPKGQNLSYTTWRSHQRRCEREHKDSTARIRRVVLTISSKPSKLARKSNFRLTHAEQTEKGEGSTDEGKMSSGGERSDQSVEIQEQGESNIDYNYDLVTDEFDDEFLTLDDYQNPPTTCDESSIPSNQVNSSCVTELDSSTQERYSLISSSKFNQSKFRSLDHSKKAAYRLIFTPT